MAGVSNADLAQQLGEVQGSLKHLVREAENGRADRGRIFETQERHELAISTVAASASAAAQAASTVAATAAEALKHIETVQKELVDTVMPAIADYTANKPHIESYKNLKLKAAGAALVLLFVGGVAMELFRFFADSIRRTIWP